MCRRRRHGMIRTATRREWSASGEEVADPAVRWLAELSIEVLPGSRVRRRRRRTAERRVAVVAGAFAQCSDLDDHLV